MNALLVSVAAAILMIAGSTIYSAVVGAQNHHAACNRSSNVITAVEDTIAILLTPAPGQTLTASQVKSINAFERAADARLDQARC